MTLRNVTLGIVSGVFWEGHFGHARAGIIVLGRLSFGLDIWHHCFSTSARYFLCVRRSRGTMPFDLRRRDVFVVKQVEPGRHRQRALSTFGFVQQK